jgi:hypothetical protein
MGSIRKGVAGVAAKKAATKPAASTTTTSGAGRTLRKRA